MKFIGTKAHGILDYLMGLLLIGSPWLLGFYEGGSETWIPVILGCSTVLFSMFTNYEYGVLRLLPMKAHLAIDFLSGALLAVSPWLFNFADTVFLPHVILGSTEVLVVLFSSTKPYTKKRVVGYPDSNVARH